MPTTFWSCLSPQIGVTPPRWRNSSALAYNSQPWLQRRSRACSSLMHKCIESLAGGKVNNSNVLWRSNHMILCTWVPGNSPPELKFLLPWCVCDFQVAALAPCSLASPSPYPDCPLQFRIEEHKLELGRYDRTNQQLGFSFFASRRKVVHWFQQNRH